MGMENRCEIKAKMEKWFEEEVSVRWKVNDGDGKMITKKIEKSNCNEN